MTTLAETTHLLAHWAEFAGGRESADQHGRHGGGLSCQDRAWAGRAPIFILVPQVKLRKRLVLARDAQRVAGAVPGLIVAGWDV